MTHGRLGRYHGCTRKRDAVVRPAQLESASTQDSEPSEFTVVCSRGFSAASYDL